MLITTRTRIIIFPCCHSAINTLSKDFSSKHVAKLLLLFLLLLAIFSSSSSSSIDCTGDGIPSGVGDLTPEGNWIVSLGGGEEEDIEPLKSLGDEGETLSVSAGGDDGETLTVSGNLGTILYTDPPAESFTGATTEGFGMITDLEVNPYDGALYVVAGKGLCWRISI